MWKYMYDDHEDFEQLARFVVGFSRRYFDKLNSANMHVRCYNDERFDAPMLITSSDPLTIRTCVTPRRWSQFIYQFSHELVHLSIRFESGYQGETCAIKWLEETICEAYSLFALHCAAKEWNLCPLAFHDPSYGVSINDYLALILADSLGSKVPTCRSYVELEHFNAESDVDRSARWAIRDAVYRSMLLFPSAISALTEYPSYARDNYPLLVNYHLWQGARSGNRIIAELFRVQNRLISPFIHEIDA